jgi:hypothetical protein
MVHGNTARMVRATVLSESDGELRVVAEGSNKPITVKASETVDAPRTFGTRLAMQQGVIIQKSLPDNANSLSRICESRG